MLVGCELHLSLVYTIVLCFVRNARAMDGYGCWAGYMGVCVWCSRFRTRYMNECADVRVYRLLVGFFFVILSRFIFTVDC